jgi:hypothetical protein
MDRVGYDLSSEQWTALIGSSAKARAFRVARYFRYTLGYVRTDIEKLRLNAS